MQAYPCKTDVIPGTGLEDFNDILAAARYEFHKIQKQTPRRQANVRSKYFHGDKIFVGLFWEHLDQKRTIEQLKRLKYYRCAIELLRNTRFDPETVISHERPGQALYRFHGLTNNGKSFYVQVKHNTRTGRKDFMSVFPSDKRR